MREDRLQNPGSTQQLKLPAQGLEIQLFEAFRGKLRS